MASYELGEDGGGVKTTKKKTAEGEEELDEDVLGVPVLVFAVEEVEGVLAGLLVLLARRGGVHGVAASSTCSAASTPDAEIQRERGGI